MNKIIDSYARIAIACHDCADLEVKSGNLPLANEVRTIAKTFDDRIEALCRLGATYSSEALSVGHRFPCSKCGVPMFEHSDLNDKVCAECMAGIDPEFTRAMAQCASGNLVDLDTALNETPPNL